MRDTADLVLLTGADDETAADQDGVDPVVQSANVAPTDRVRVLLVEDGRLVLRRHVWGLIPSWSKSADGAARMINARVETVTDKPAFRSAIRTSRCLLPADGWYEWERSAAGRQPHLVRRADAKPLWLAGIWAQWRPPGQDAPMASAAVLTGPAPAELTWLHERAPLVVPDPLVRSWLNSRGEDPAALLEALVAAGYPPLDWHPVSKAIGQVRDKRAELMAPDAPAAAPVVASLF